MELLDAKKAPCDFCMGKAKGDKLVFVVKGHMSGTFCAEHLEAIVKQQKNGKPETSPFDKATS